MKVKNLFAALLLMVVALGTNVMTAQQRPLMSQLPKKGKSSRRVTTRR